jgi:four helix bundle protein
MIGVAGEWCQTTARQAAHWRMQDFKRIQAWRRAHELAIRVNECVVGFTRAGQANLQAQITRSVTSVPTNIVEGCGAATNKEFARYLDIAIKSLSETEYHLLAARDFGVLPPDRWQKLTAETVEIRKMLFRYRRKLLMEPVVSNLTPSKLASDN